MVGTIAEAAAAARAAADRPQAALAREDANDQPRHSPCDEAGDETAATPAGGAEAESHDSVAPRRAKAPAVEVAEDAERTAAHLIAGRAYAYGRTIVETKGEALRTGDKLAIES